MSGLDIVAGIAGVASAAIKISISMNDLADNLGSAGRDVRYISNEMANFSQVLRLVHSSLEDSTKLVGSAFMQSTLSTIPQLIEQCELVHEEANGLMVALKPSTSRDSSLPFIKRVRFIFQKSRITVLRSLLDSSKSTLSLLLNLLDIEMAKMKDPNKALMDQLQSERRVFIQMVDSQRRALNDALKEVEKAKKETAKLRNKAVKEKQKQDEATKKANEKQKNGEDHNHNDSTLKPPPMYSLVAPSVSQLVYTPPPINTDLQTAVVSLALSLEAPNTNSSTGGQAAPPTPPQYPCSAQPSNRDTDKTIPNSKPATQPQPPPPPLDDSIPTEPVPSKAQHARPDSTKRVFSDPGPGKSETKGKSTPSPESTGREQFGSPQGASQTPQAEFPRVKRKPFPPKQSLPPPPLYGITYISLQSYSSDEVGHLCLELFDTLVDVVLHAPEEESATGSTISEAHECQYWQASLRHRRGPRGLLPHDIVCPIDDEKVDEKMKACWFSATSHLIADASGRVWVGPMWEFQEPKRRRSKWWAEEF